MSEEKDLLEYIITIAKKLSEENQKHLYAVALGLGIAQIYGQDNVDDDVQKES